MRKNWKTTASGAATAIGMGLTQSDDPTLNVIGRILSILGPLLIGLFSKDHNVSGL